MPHIFTKGKIMKYTQSTLADKTDSPVYLTLLKNFDLERQKYCGKYDKTIAIQKCGSRPYELALRFAGCCLWCGPCFASGYSWPGKFRNNPRVTNKKSAIDVVEDYRKISYPSESFNYNWLRILGGEPLLNDNYIQFLFDALITISNIDSEKFSNGIIIQTNGIHIGKGNVNMLKKKLKKFHDVNPLVKVVVEISIKGTNVDEFKLITQVPDASARDLFDSNIESYFVLKKLAHTLPNLRPMVVAGFGVNESYLLTEGASNDRIAIIFQDNKPTYHPKFWSGDFRRLYDDFTSTYKTLDPMFSKMPMYGIKDQFAYPWVRRTIKQGKRVYGDKWYDKKYAPERGGKNIELERSFTDILDKFFLVDNQKYYSTMIK